MIALVGFLAWYGLAVVEPFARARTYGFPVYFTAARVLVTSPEDFPRVYDEQWFAEKVRGEFPGIYDIYNVHPPTMALMMLPFLGLGPEGARAAWTYLGVGFVAIALGCLARASRVSLWAFAMALPACLLLHPITENLELGQAYLLVMLLQSVTLASLAVGSDRAAGTALGVMLALKSAGAWQWPLLLIAGRRRALGWGALTFLVIAGACLPAVGLDAWRTYAGLLPSLFLTPKRLVLAYQTVTSLAGHLFIEDAQWNPHPAASLPMIGAALPVLVSLVALVVTARTVDLTSRDDTLRILSLALIGSLAVTNTPVAQGYHYAAVLPSLVVAYFAASRMGLPWWGWVALGVPTLLLGLPIEYNRVELRAHWTALQAYPRVYGAYALWGWLLWALSVVRRRAQASATLPDRP